MGTVGRNQPHRQELDETRRNKKMCRKTEDAGETLGQDDNHTGGCQKSCHFDQVGFQAMKMKPHPEKTLSMSHIFLPCVHNALSAESLQIQSFCQPFLTCFTKISSLSLGHC